MNAVKSRLLSVGGGTGRDSGFINLAAGSQVGPFCGPAALLPQGRAWTGLAAWKWSRLSCDTGDMLLERAVDSLSSADVTVFPRCCSEDGPFSLVACLLIMPVTSESESSGCSGCCRSSSTDVAILITAAADAHTHTHTHREYRSCSFCYCTFTNKSWILSIDDTWRHQASSFDVMLLPVPLMTHFHPVCSLQSGKFHLEWSVCGGISQLLAAPVLQRMLMPSSPRRFYETTLA